jgi:hypothetical protein
LPFVGRTAGDLLRKHIFEHPPSIDSSRKVTPEFESLLHKLLAKKESDRPETMGDFLKAFRTVRIFTDEPSEALQAAEAGMRP